MRVSIPIRNRLWLLARLAVWISAVGACWWLHRQGEGARDAVGVAQARVYKVAAAELGRLAALDVVEGQRVSKGQVVARLETDLTEREISIAQARLRQLDSEVHATGASLDGESLQTERGFQSEAEAADIELKAANAEFARDRAELDRVHQDLKKQRELVGRGLAKADRMREMELRRAALEESVKTWPARIEAIEARRQSAGARLAVWRRTHGGAGNSSRKTQLQPLRDRLGEQHEQLQLLAARLRGAALTAASDAYVSAILASPGDVLKPGDPVLTLVDDRPRQVVAYLDERRAAVLEPGTRVVGRRKNGTGTWVDGRIVAVSGGVTEFPSRFWLAPNLPVWGREFYVELAEPADLDPGEALDLKLTPASRGARELASVRH